MDSAIERRVVLCAGHACAERASCARYLVRGGEFPWASYDIERSLEKYAGQPCLAKINVQHERQVKRKG
jgi:hypothetical protein